ncbi:hypothetical protein [Falsiroseomonas sp.]|uniref:hypothetical protein n=1 Tax=Falsiroseomonas sp. TaxID=2870721 RepID=UPI002733387A|nr:hypothetical protein [Falsiroseomonas sp.]MDP3416386.1 hypothetical protein [Falsiroseomonas sp.]
MDDRVATLFQRSYAAFDTGPASPRWCGCRTAWPGSPALTLEQGLRPAIVALA